MRRSRFSQQEIAKILTECASGRRTADVCREHTISTTTLYQWKKTQGGKTQDGTENTSTAAHAPNLELENQRLRQRIVDLRQVNEALKGELRRLRSHEEL